MLVIFSETSQPYSLVKLLNLQIIKSKRKNFKLYAIACYI